MTGTERRVSADEARRDFRSLLDEVQQNHEHVTIMRYSRPVAVLVPIAWHSAALDYIRLSLDEAAEAADALAVIRAIDDSLRAARRAAGLPPRRQPADHRVVNHIDGDPRNNDPASLEITDPRKNQ